MGGKVGFLPDVSKNFNYNMIKADQALEMGQYGMAANYLLAVNANFPPEYIIEFNDDEYFRQIRQNRFYECQNCTTEIEKIINQGEEDEHIKKITQPTRIPASEVRSYDYFVGGYHALMTNDGTVRVWNCPECNEMNPTFGAKIITQEMAQPFFTRVYYNQPRRGIGLSQRQTHDKIFKKWFFGLKNNEYQIMVSYRVEYVNANNGQQMEEPLYEQKGDLVLASNN